MPVRIYDISKKLGLENKEVISKAKALGIAAAKVASSSLDKITAEYLEEQILKDHPELTAPKPLPEPPKPAPPEPILIVSAPPAPPPPIEPPAPAPVTATIVEVPAPESISTSAESSEPPAPVVPVVPPAPVEPPKPKVGEKVGFIQLTQRPSPRPGDRGGNVKPVIRPVEPGRTDFLRRGDNRPMRGGTSGPSQ